MKAFGVGAVAAFWVCAGAVRAAEQTWNEAGVDNVWSTNASNWAGGAVWTNGNSAVFSGAGGTQTGETVDVSASVSVANLTFLTNGYVIADADGDGALSFAGGGEARVVNAGDSAVVSEAIGGAGFTKSGNGVLLLSGINTFTGNLTVAQGTLRLSKYAYAVLGATGAGNDTIVASGATLDIYGAYTDNYNRVENLYISGTGVNNQGALVNTGNRCMNSGLSGTMTLLGDTLVNCQNRIDFRGTVVGNNYTLTKIGSQELAVGVEVLNCKIVVNNGYYTYMNAKALGTGDFDTTMNGGALRSYGNQTVTEHLICNGGSFIAAGWGNNTFTIAGLVTLNSNVVVTASADNGGTGTLNLSGLLEGTGGIRRQGSGHYVFVTCDTNTYSGPTIIDSGCSLWVGKPTLCSGVLGYGAVTNAGTLYGYSPRLCYGPLVNQGALYCNTGVVSMGSVSSSGKLYLNGGILGTGSVANSGSLYCFSPSLGAGEVTNTGSLYFDGTNLSHVVSNAVYGSGAAYLRYGSTVTLAGYYTNASWRVGMGTLTLTNGATVFAGSGLSLSERQSMGYSVDPSNVVSVLNIRDGASLTMAAISAGNGSGGCMTSIVTQTGGRVLTTGWTGNPANFPGEMDGLHLGHWPASYSEWNISGGTLTVDNGYRLAIAIDGTGVVHQTGGEIYAQSVVVNARDISPGGYGRLTVEGGALNVGSNGITAGAGAAYLVEYGGAGGIVRASTNFASSLNATLYGTNGNAITFDTTNWDVTLSGKLTGAGGLNKAGAGTLTLSGTNTYAGGTRILQGRVVRGSAKALPSGGVVLFGVTADDAGGQLYASGDLSLEGVVAGVANPEALDKSKSYTIAAYGGTLTAKFMDEALPAPWSVYYDGDHKRVQLKVFSGTVFWLR